MAAVWVRLSAICHLLRKSAVLRAPLDDRAGTAALKHLAKETAVERSSVTSMEEGDG
jgi:hypothetical protein